MSAELILYTREGCHLCEQMQRELVILKDWPQFPLRIVDIDEDPALRERFNEKVPVLALGEDIICCHRLDRHGLAAALRPD